MHRDGGRDSEQNAIGGHPKGRFPQTLHCNSHECGSRANPNPC
jgi:hypothetical protein